MEGLKDRKYWVDMLVRISHSVLSAGAERKLMAVMPEEAKVPYKIEQVNLEAVGRVLTGMAPWFELEGLQGEEEELRNKYAILARSTIDSITDPNSPDYCDFSNQSKPTGQALVDAAFLAHSIVRAPRELWVKLDERVKQNLIKALVETKKIRPPRCNWLLFSAMVEAGMYVMGEPCDMTRVDYAIAQHEQWYKGDGVYGDGEKLHWDYYNSYVIQPMLLDIVNTLGHFYTERQGVSEQMKDRILQRAKRYAAIQEMTISPEGTFPAIGRSITYRCGAFQLLAQIALQHQLPEAICPAQVRCALTKVIKNCMEAEDTFCENGWLKIGLCGYQPNLAEEYISMTSLYLCTTAFLPLGLSPQDEFWNSKAEKWSSQKIWSGENVNRDHSIWI